jgi:hypothetical protein
MSDSPQGSSEVVSIGRWILAYFLCSISCGIGFIVYCFNDNKSLSNWAKARLIMIAAVLLLYVVVFGAAFLMGLLGAYY